MAATRSQAEQCDPNALDALIEEWQTAHDTVTASLDKTSTEYHQSQSFWTGKTGDRARDTAQQAVTAGRTFTGELNTAITTLTADRDAIWGAKNRATQAISNAINAKYEVTQDGTVEPSHEAELAVVTSVEDPKDQVAAKAALRKYGKDTLQPPIKSALVDLGTAVETATVHIQGAFQNSGGVTTAAVEAPGKLDPSKRLTADQGKEDGATIADGKLSAEERQRILDHLAATGLSKEQLKALQNGQDVTIPQSSMDYLTSLYDKAGRDGLLTFSETLKNENTSESQALRHHLANGMMTLSNEHLVTRDQQGKIAERGGFGKLNSEIREIVGTRPNIGGAPDSNTRGLPDDYRTSLFGPKIDERSAIKDYTADMDKFADFVNCAGRDQQPGARFGVELGRQAAHQAWILDHGGYGDWEGTELRDEESKQHTENSASNLLGAASRNHDSSYALITGHGSDELFGKGTPGQSWHKYDASGTMETLLTHEWNDEGTGLGSLVKWTGADAYNSDPARAAHAGEAAGVVAEMLTSTKTDKGSNFYASMMDMPGHEKHSFAQVNPEAAKGIALGLRPFTGDIVGSPPELTGTRGFPTEALGPVEVTRLFSIFNGNEEAGATMNGAALAQAEQIDRRFSALAARDGLEPADFGQYSGRLRGVVNSGMDASVADLYQNETDRAKALTDQRAATYGVAQNLLGAAGVVGTVGGLGGPAVQALSEYYKNPLTSVDPDYSGHTPSPMIKDTTYNIQQIGTDGSRRYSMLAALIDSGQVSSSEIPAEVRNIVLDQSDDGTYTVRPYVSVVGAREAADTLDKFVPNLLDKYGISNDGQVNYLRNSDQGAAAYKNIFAGVRNSDQMIQRLKTDELEKGYNSWPTTR